MNLDDAIGRYMEQRCRYRRAAEAVGKAVEVVAKFEQIACTVTAREKEPHSYLAKVVAKGYTDAWRQVTDKAGARVIVTRASDVDAMTQALEQSPLVSVLRVEDKRQVSDPEKLGYSGVHIQVVAPEEDDDSETIECEVQVRTAAQDAWSVVSHKLLYKPVVQLPPAEQHAVYRLVALIELFDEEVERLMNVLPSLPGYEHQDILLGAESEFMGITHAQSYRQLSVIILDALGDVIPHDEGYPAQLRAFVESQQEELVDVFGRYGPGSAMSAVPQYTLFGQAESLILLERMLAIPFKLKEVWLEAGLPLEWLRTLASVSPAQLDLD